MRGHGIASDSLSETKSKVRPKKKFAQSGGTACPGGP